MESSGRERLPGIRIGLGDRIALERGLGLFCSPLSLGISHRVRDGDGGDAAPEQKMALERVGAQDEDKDEGGEQALLPRRVR